MTLQALLAAISEAQTNELPVLAMALAARMAATAARVAVPAAMSEAAAPEPAGRWIRPEKAAEIAGEPLETPDAKRRAVRRIYSGHTANGGLPDHPADACGSTSPPSGGGWRPVNRPCQAQAA
jgi:hypothetical protein